MGDKQLFFRADDKDAAYKAHKKRGHPIWAVVDKRSQKPKPLMFVVCSADELVTVHHKMLNARMFKRMWEFKVWVKVLPF